MYVKRNGISSVEVKRNGIATVLIYRNGIPINFNIVSPTQYTVATAVVGSGTLTVNGVTSLTADEGTTLTFAITPNTGYELSGLSEELPSTLTENGTYTATFVETSIPVGASVLDYGAVADAVVGVDTITGTDNTAAFQAAIAANDTVIIPVGDYLIDGTVDVDSETVLYEEDGAKIYTNAIDGTKSAVFSFSAGASHSTLWGLDVRSFDKYTAYMPGDAPTGQTSNRYLVGGSSCTDLLIRNTDTHSLRGLADCFGFHRLEVTDSAVYDAYICLWVGSTAIGVTVDDINIHDSYFETNDSADIYSHTIYCGFGNDGFKFERMQVKQKSTECGAILNFAWVSGSLGTYYVHNVVVNDVEILDSYTVNQVIQCYGVENMTLNNIRGKILDSPDGSGVAIIKVSNSNGQIAFTNCDIEFDQLTTAIRSTESNLEYNVGVSFTNCDFTFNSLEGHFIQAYVNAVSFSGGSLTFHTFSTGGGLYESCKNVSFSNVNITFDDYFKLAASVSQPDDQLMSVSITGCTIQGNSANQSYYMINGVGITYGLIFVGNSCGNLFPDSRDGSNEIADFTHANYVANHSPLTFASNTFDGTPVTPTTYTVTVVSNGNGSVYVDTNQASITGSIGTALDLVVTPDSGYELDSWDVTPPSTIQGDVTYTATFIETSVSQVYTGGLVDLTSPTSEGGVSGDCVATNTLSNTTTISNGSSVGYAAYRFKVSVTNTLKTLKTQFANVTGLEAVRVRVYSDAGASLIRHDHTVENTEISGTFTPTDGLIDIRLYCTLATAELAEKTFSLLVEDV